MCCCTKNPSLRFSFPIFFFFLTSFLFLFFRFFFRFHGYSSMVRRGKESEREKNRFSTLPSDKHDLGWKESSKGTKGQNQQYQELRGRVLRKKKFRESGDKVSEREGRGEMKEEKWNPETWNFTPFPLSLFPFLSFFLNFSFYLPFSLSPISLTLNLHPSVSQKYDCSWSLMH